MQDYNNNIIKEFHENEGKVGGPFAGAPMILVTHTGAKSGTQRTNPLVYLKDGDRYLIFASKGGSTSHPTGTATSSPTQTPPPKSVPKSSTSSPKS